MAKIKVALSYIHYPVAMGKYFEAALRRRSDVDLFTVGPYSGSWIPWAGGMQLPQKYAKPPDCPISLYPHKPPPPTPVSFVEARLPWQPDLWLQVDAGWFLQGQPQHGKNVIVGTDPHVLDYDRQRQLADTFYCMQSVYAQPGDEYLPYAYDPIWHAPEKTDYHYDACLIGLHYPQRNQLVERLRQRGLDVYYDLGPCYDEARTLYNQAPIGLNWSSRQDLTARVFELLGMGRLAVVNRVPDLDKFFEDGKHLVVFDTLDEAVEKVAHYNENGASKIMEQGREAVQAHTWDARIEQILRGI